MNLNSEAEKERMKVKRIQGQRGAESEAADNEDEGTGITMAWLKGCSLLVKSERASVLPPFSSFSTPARLVNTMGN